jgi:hypothetical protein
MPNDVDDAANRFLQVVEASLASVEADHANRFGGISRDYDGIHVCMVR